MSREPTPGRPAPVLMLLALLSCDTAHRREAPASVALWPAGDRIQPVIDALDRACRERTIYMIGPEKGRRLAELVRDKRPRLVVECGTAIGYSGLWIGRELKNL